ncbi:ABC transporter substrate-binding protein [Aquibacillus salsiterrae]|uniref:Extracellular solute-binding protein n=1 Tax=Aquibacillus salsiterrae TaxID=2950439 RepID=A0A9X3WG50_9BACI|nr:extracellular solute-binding protein [Aquibacillus salsiterrae]MDC3418038.1 extracellular solute-binding protein [Aquibacillus salsiterrae]
MKLKLFLVVCMLSVFTLAACSSESGSVEGQNSDIEVVSDIEGTVRVALAGFQLEDGMDPITGVENKGMKTFIKEQFTPRYPNIKVELTQVPWENAKAKQTAMLQSGDVDVLYSGGAFASQWNQKGLLKPLDGLIENDDSFDSSLYLEGLWKGSYSTKSFDKTVHFGIPAVLGRRVTIYDQEIFDQWGVEPLSENPSPQEVLEKAKQMTGENPETGKQNYGLWFDGKSLNASTFVALTHAFGAPGAEGSLDDLANIKWKLNSPEMVKVLEWIEEAAQLPPSGFVNAEGAENFGIEGNDIAIRLDGSGAATMGEVRATDDDALIDRFKPVLNLGPDGQGWVAVDPYVMAKDAQNVEASWEVLKFLTGYEAQKHNYENYTMTPTLADADFVSDQDTFMKVAADIASVTKSTLMDEANPFFSSEITPAINGFISKASNGNAPEIQPFLDNLQERAEKWSANQ